MWQNRFSSCVPDGMHLLRAMAYIERNPVRARVVRTAWRYAWPSAAAHAGETRASELPDLREWRGMWVSRPDRRRKALREREDEELAGRLRLSTHTGRPLATDSLLSRLEHKLGRRLRPLPAGRPKKAKNRDTGRG